MTRGRIQCVAGLLGVVAAALPAAGCGVRPTGVIGAGEAPTATATSLPETTVYFLLHGRLQPVARVVPPWNTNAVFDALLAGPTAEERARGLRTALDGTAVTVRDLGPKGVVVTGDDQTVPPIAYAQVACTTAGLPQGSAVSVLAPVVALKVALVSGCPDSAALRRVFQYAVGLAPPGSAPNGAASVAPVPAPTTGGAGPQRADRQG